VQIYWEWMLDLKTDTMEIAQEIGLEKKLRWENFSPFPVWNTIRPMECTDGSFDLYAFTWAETFQSNTNTQEQPWVDEMSRLNPYTYYVNMNAGTAAKKGLKAGDRIELDRNSRVFCRHVRGCIPNAST
jgi:anaerobic selenocysteine-containing dehydrogenase